MTDKQLSKKIEELLFNWQVTYDDRMIPRFIHLFKEYSLSVLPEGFSKKEKDRLDRVDKYFASGVNATIKQAKENIK